MSGICERRHAVVFLALVACFVVLAGECIRSNPVLVDEYAHVPAGLGCWETGCHYLYRENPPFVRMLSALPVWLSNPKTDYARAARGYRSEWHVGMDFISRNGARHQALYEVARSVVLFLAVACALTMFVWGTKLYGSAAALVATALWLTDPTVLANSSTATVDIGATTVGFIATYLFWRFLQKPGWTVTLLAGLGLGLAQASKFSLLILYPAWLIGMCLQRGWPWRLAEPLQTAAGPREARKWNRLLVMFALSLLTLNAVYAFDGSCKSLGSYQFKSLLLTSKSTLDVDDTPSANRFRGTWLDSFPVPLPEDYIRGFDSQKWDEEFGFFRLSHGRLVFRGTPISPLTTLAYKLPMGTLVLILFSASFWLFRSRRRCIVECLVCAPVGLLLVLLGTQTGLNWPARYFLPAIPFLFLSLGGAVRVGLEWPRLRWLIGLCLLWNTIALLGARPHYLSYANELIGGPDGARGEFAGSNFDWGQDLYRLRRWRDEHSDGTPLIVLFFGALDPNYLGLNDGHLPDGFLDTGEYPPEQSAEDRKPFYLAISKTLLDGVAADVYLKSGRFVYAIADSPWLKYDNAIERVGQTIYIFRVVPGIPEGETTKAITYDQLRASFREVTLRDRRTYTLL